MYAYRNQAHQLLLSGVVAIVLPVSWGCASSGSGDRVAEPIYVSEPLPEEELAAVRYPNLREELLYMEDRDQRARRGMRVVGDDNDDGPLATMTRIDKENTARMHEIVDEVAGRRRARSAPTEHKRHGCSFSTPTWTSRFNGGALS